MKESVLDNALEEQLQSLRGRIEADLPRPSLIVVTSAAAGDGKSLIAFGLARSMAQAGYKAAVVDTNHANPEVEGGPSVTDMRGRDDFDVCRFARRSDHFEDVDVVPLTDRRVQTSTSKKLVESIAGQLRFIYDFTIIDTTRLLRGHMGMLFATCSDGVLICVRHGRMLTADDGFTVRQLERTGRKLWVVTATSGAIKQFGRTRVEQQPQREILLGKPEPVPTYAATD
jgi:Mrp family chromosome partitioning ATPase